MKEYIIKGVKFTQREHITADQYIEVYKLLEKHQGDANDLVTFTTKMMMGLVGSEAKNLVNILLKTENNNIVQFDFIGREFSMEDLGKVIEYFLSHNDIYSVVEKMQAMQKSMAKHSVPVPQKKEGLSK